MTTVPSSERARDEHHPLRSIVGEIVEPTRGRHERLLRRSDTPLEPRAWDARRYRAIRPLDHARVLLIDDTWTTGARAQTAAAALMDAGAATVAAVVVGRFINPEYKDNAARLAALPPTFSWMTCAVHEG